MKKDDAYKKLLKDENRYLRMHPIKMAYAAVVKKDNAKNPDGSFKINDDYIIEIGIESKDPEYEEKITPKYVLDKKVQKLFDFDKELKKEWLSGNIIFESVGIIKYRGEDPYGPSTIKYSKLTGGNNCI